MKKLIAFLLVIVMLLPFCLVTGTAEAVPEKKPFYVTYWHSSPAGEDFVGDYCYAMPYFWCHPIKEGDKQLKILTRIGEGGGSNDPIKGAALLKELLDTYPEGTRYMNFSPLPSAFSALVEDVIYMDKGVEYIKAWLDPFLAEYKRIGGKLDGIIIDLEYREGYSWYLSGRMDKDPTATIMNDIVQNPQYKTRLRPLLEERGFEFYPDPNEYTPEIYSAYEKSGDKYATSRSIWDVAIRTMLIQYINESVYDTMLKYYPEGNLCDYESKANDAWLKTTGVSVGGNSVGAGNTSNDNFYGDRPVSTYFVENGVNKLPQPPGRYQAILEDTVFTSFLYEANVLKGVQASADNGKVSSWITFFGYSKRATSVCNTPYYAEQILHQGLLDSQPFLGYIIQSDTGGPEQFTHAMNVLNDIMGELTRLVGYSDRKPIQVPTTWNSSFVLSGMYANGRNVWRITPDITGAVTKETFKVEGEDPTFSINGQTVTFPGGKIVEDGSVREVGTCGYWVETAAEVYPVITSVENRYQEYPTFLETYENYEVGMEYNYNNAYPATCWNVKKDKTGSSVIQEDANGNQVLALSGKYVLTNNSIPKMVKAGDTYAKNQAWEVTVTVPADMAADAEITLLNFANKSDGKADGGIKISGGKLWYDQAGEYVELTGVDVSKGGKFTVRRVLNFTTEEAFTSTYQIFDGEGNLLKEAKDIPTLSIKLPVTGIGLGCVGITGDPVLLDNYKLYPLGVATDFELYDAATGIQVDEMDVAREKDTAYRLSWMNAGTEEKTFSVVAAYYDGEGKVVEEKVLEEIKMVPGTDGVATGIVKNETEGQTLLVYFKEVTPKRNNSILVPIIATVVVLAIAGAGVAIVMKPKSAKKETE